ncbi:MAG: VRR-NUC domain-containing protein [Oscillospiraceae bacterium]|nr:VRR-NUC domain-containing protein [Oscillospiraceae bacterium]
MREREIEKKLVDAVKTQGGVCWKFVSPGTAGVPDRIILMPMGRIAFVEVKAPGESPRKLQLARHRFLRRLGYKTFVLDNPEQIGGILDEIQTP